MGIFKISGLVGSLYNEAHRILGSVFGPPFEGALEEAPGTLHRHLCGLAIAPCGSRLRMDMGF